MIAIIAALALLTALIALWLGSTTMRKMEAGNAELKRALMSEVEEFRVAMERRITAMEKRLNSFDGKMDVVVDGHAQTQSGANRLGGELVKLRKDLERLQARIPRNLLKEDENAAFRRDLG